MGRIFQTFALKNKVHSYFIISNGFVRLYILNSYLYCIVLLQQCEKSQYYLMDLIRNHTQWIQIEIEMELGLDSQIKS